jgi:glycosyltransferase involved in cell wall biosynthesis
MIVCYSKNERGHRLFSELSKLDPAYRDIGVAKPSIIWRAMGAIISIQPRIRRTIIDAGFSPIVCQAVEARCRDLVAGFKNFEAVLYWGAQNRPVTGAYSNIPYYIITDGPFDPDDPSYPDEWRPNRWAKEYLQRQRQIYSRARHVFTLSEWAREKLVSVHNLPQAKISRIGWGPIHEIEEPNLMVGHPKYFVSIGSDWHRKGMDIVARAAREFHQIDPSYMVVIAGRPNGIHLDAAPGLVVIPREIPGFVAQTLIANARALIIGARFDASPHVIYEALAAGTPVIGTNVCAIPEAIREPLGGIVVPPGDQEALVTAMQKIAGDDLVAQRKSAFSVALASGGWRRSAEIVHNTIIRTAS